MRRQTTSRLTSYAAGLVLAGVAAACSPTADDRAAASGRLRIDFEDQPAPEVFERQGEARRAAETAPGGLWGVVSGLSRAERAVVRDTATGAEVTVPLFSGPTDGAAIVLSRAAADALGMEEGPVAVTVTALRREPTLQATRNGF